MKTIAWIALVMLLAPFAFYVGQTAALIMNDNVNAQLGLFLWLVYIMPAVALAALVLSKKRREKP